MMGVVEQVGQDHKGDLIYRFDKNKGTFTTEIWDDTLLIRKELALKNSLAEGNCQ